MSKKKIDVYRTGIYLRLSQGDEDIDGWEKQESNSISNQRLLLEGFIDAHDDLKLVDVFIDDGYTGSNFDRPEFQRMMKSMKAGNLDCIMVKDLSRLGRERIGVDELILRTFKEYGVRFISVSDNYDSLTANRGETHTIIPFKNLMNEQYNNDTSLKVRTSQQVKRMNGQFIGAFVPYGYKKAENNKNLLVPDPYAAGVVQGIFAKKLAGVSAMGIAKILNKNGVLSPSEYKTKCGEKYNTSFKGAGQSKWSAKTVIRILKNVVYTGTLAQGKRTTVSHKVKKGIEVPEEDWIVVENTHEPIVNKELFDKVRKVLGQKVEESSFASERGKNLPIKDDIFAGILFCGNCKRRLPQLSRIIEKDGRLERQYFYACRYNYDFGGEKCGCNILEQELVKAVHKILEVNIAALTESEKTEAVVKGVMDNNLKQCDGQIRKLEKLIEKQNYEESKAYQRYVIGEVSKDEFKRMQEKSADAVMRLRGQISDKQAKYRRNKRFFEKKLQWLRAIYRFQSEPYLDRNMLEILVHSIYLYPDNRMEINLNFKDEYLEWSRLQCI